MLCKECVDCFWYNANVTSKSEPNCDDSAQVCIPVPKAHVMAIAKDIAYKRYDKTKTGSVVPPTALDISQALMMIYGKKRKSVSMKSIEKAMMR